jgi:co-chaperonin GroES (HSP10)
VTFRAYQDNVVLSLDPLEKQTASGLAIVDSKPKHRWATVIASGPGFYTSLHALIANEVQPGDRVIVDALAGQNYALDLSVPRHNKSTQFQELFGERGEFRIVREQEILAVLG